MVRNAMLAWQSHAFVRGVRDMLPPIFEKNGAIFVRYGVYFAAILSERNCKNVHFLYKSYRYCNRVLNHYEL